MRKIKKKNEIIKNYIYNNLKELSIMGITFIIGIIIGIILINNLKTEGKEEVKNYINGFINSTKENNEVDKYKSIKKTLKINIIIGIIIWISGTTLVGIPIVYGVIGYRGFCFGYTIASFIATLGFKNGILISITGIFLQNIIFIPSIILISSSGIKLYKSIIKEKNRQNIRSGIYKHSLISAIGLFGIFIASLVETFISSNFVTFFVKYI